MHAVCVRHKLLLVLLLFNVRGVEARIQCLGPPQLSAMAELHTSHKPQPFKVPALVFHPMVKTMFIETWWQTPLCWPHNP